MYESKRFLFLTTIVTILTLFLYIDYLFNKNSYLDEKIYDLKLQYNSYITSKKDVTDLLLEREVLSHENIINSLYQSYLDSNTTNKNREEIYEALLEQYTYLSSKGYNVFHLYDSQGNSFLRFHKPKKFGDSLLELRPSIRNITQTHLPQIGLEIGKHFEEIRYIYPLFHQQTYIGSVELALQPYTLLDSMNENFKGRHMLLLEKKLIDAKVTKKDIEELYKQSPISTYYINTQTNKDSVFDLTPLVQMVEYRLHADKALAVSNINFVEPSYVYVFLPIKNINNEKIGYLVSKQEDTIINSIIVDHIIKFALLLGFLLIAVIIYNRRQHKQDEVEKNLEQYKYAIDQAAIVSKTTPQGRITYVNEKFCEVSGHTQEELLGNSHSIVRHPEMTEPFFKQMWKTIQDKKIWHGVIKNRKKNGQDYYVQSTIMPILDKEGEIVEFIAIREDITELIQRKNEIQSEKDLITLVVKHIQELVVVQKDNKIIYVNDRFFEFLPFYSFQELKQKHSNIYELFVQENSKSLTQEKQRKILKQAQANPQIAQVVYIKNKDQEVYSFNLFANKVPYGDTHIYLYNLIPLHKASKLSTKVIEPKEEIKKEENVPTKEDINYESFLLQIQERLHLSEEIVLKLVEKFLSSTSQTIPKLELAINNKDIETIKHTVHNIKGSSSTLGFDSISKLALEMEEVEQQDEKIYELFNQLIIEINKITTAKEKYENN